MASCPLSFLKSVIRSFKEKCLKICFKCVQKWLHLHIELAKFLREIFRNHHKITLDNLCLNNKHQLCTHCVLIWSHCFSIVQSIAVVRASSLHASHLIKSPSIQCESGPDVDGGHKILLQSFAVDTSHH